MTICIVATCQNQVGKEQKIVLCHDWKVSTAVGSAETKHKVTWLGTNWVALWSGNEGDIMGLAAILNQQFRAQTVIDETNAVHLVRTALGLRKKEKAEELTQGRYALSYDDFLKIGKDKLPADIYRDTITEIGNLRIGAEAIVTGFTATDFMIIETDRNGRAILVEDFAAIGEGAYLAQSVLLQRSQIDVATLEDTIYVLYEAKRYAEHVSSVGKITSIDVMTRDKPSETVTTKCLQTLDDLFQRYGPKPISRTQISLGEGFLRLISVLDGAEPSS